MNDIIRRYNSAFFGMLLLVAVGVLVVPHWAQAVFTDGDKICAAAMCYPGKCTPQQPGCVPCPTISCPDITNTRTTQARCVNSMPGVCRGTSSEDLQGNQKGMGGQIPKEIMDIMKGLLDKLMKGGGGGDKGGQQGVGQNPFNQQQPCLTTYTVTTPTNDPCAIYNPTVNNLLTSTLGQGSGQGLASDLFKNLLGAESTTTGSGGIGASLSASNEEDLYETEYEGGVDGSGASGGTSDKVRAAMDAEEVASSVGAGIPDRASVSDDLFSVTSITDEGVGADAGKAGDTNFFQDFVGRFEESGTRVTAIGGGRDETSGVEVSGFYGQTGVPGGGMIARLCISRPWAGSIVSYVVPSSFFDSLCESRGYATTLGTPAPTTPTVPAKPVAPAKPDTEKPKPQIPTVTPEAHVWAVPARVSVGSRTSIFWNSKGVESCTVTSPDGSFSETGFSGGASTVSLSGATIFTISCERIGGGEPVVDHVTVEMAI